MMIFKHNFYYKSPTKNIKFFGISNWVSSYPKYLAKFTLQNNALLLDNQKPKIKWPRKYGYNCFWTFLSWIFSDFLPSSGIKIQLAFSQLNLRNKCKILIPKKWYHILGLSWPQWLWFILKFFLYLSPQGKCIDLGPFSSW